MNEKGVFSTDTNLADHYADYAVVYFCDAEKPVAAIHNASYGVMNADLIST